MAAEHAVTLRACAGMLAQRTPAVHVAERQRAGRRCASRACITRAGLRGEGKRIYVESGDAGCQQAARAAGFQLLRRGQPPGGEPGLFVDEGGALFDDGKRVGRIVRIHNAADAAAAALLAGTEEVLLVEPADGCWQIIPAENLVAAFAGSRTTLLLAAATSDDAAVLLGALETGVDGIVLATEDAAQLTQLAAHLQGRRAAALGARYVEATITRIQPVGCACVAWKLMLALLKCARRAEWATVRVWTRRPCCFQVKACCSAASRAVSSSCSARRRQAAISRRARFA